MSEVKNKNCSNTASVFSSKLFSIIAATMLLLLIDGGINNNSNAKIGMVSNMTVRVEALEALAKINFKTLPPSGPPPSSYGDRNLKFKKDLAIRIQSLEKLMGLTPIRDPSSLNRRDLSDRMEALEQAFAMYPPATQQTSGTQDLINNGINPTETPYPVKVCDALFNGQNLCTEQTVTAVVGALAVGLIGGIVAIIQTEINNKQNTDKQIENSKNLLTLLTLSQQKQAPCVPTQQNNFCGTVP